MITVHGSYGTRAHVTGNNQGAFFGEKNQFSKVAVREQHVHFLQFFVWNDASARNVLETIGKQLSGAIVEKPETRHGGIVGPRVILRHFSGAVLRFPSLGQDGYR